MLKGIEFTDKRFKIEDDYNVLGELTENTIILCNNYKLMDSLANEILDTMDYSQLNLKKKRYLQFQEKNIVLQML